MARGRTLGKMLRMAVICLTIGVLLGMSPALVKAAAGGYEPGDTLGEATSISTDGTEVAPQALSISGVVKNESAVPIEGAHVFAFYDGIIPVYDYDLTGAGGTYSITGLTAGSYVVWAEASGYVTEYYNNVYDPSLATTVASDATNIDFTLGLAGSISGMVKDGAGNPIQFALVNAEGYDFTGFDYAEANGTYSIDGLTPGSYLVWAEASGYITEYYNNVYDSSSATRVTVTALNDTPDIDFTLGTGGSVPPSVTTNDATIITVSSARLNGNLTSLDSAGSVTVSFEWKVSGGSYTPIDVEVKNSTGTFSVGLTGLTPGTTYYFKAKAVGDGDPVYGAEKSFTTLVSPSVTTNAATGIGNTSATLNGNLTSLGTASTVTVSFVWGTSFGGPYPNETTGQAMTSTGAFSAELPSLIPGTTYYYQAKAVGDSTVYGVERSFTTTTTPPVVTTGVPTGIDLTLATLNGNLDSLGTAGSVAVSFEWGITLGGPYPYETTSENMTTTGTFYFDLSGLDPGTTYYYRAKAVGDGDPVYGSGMNFTTGPSPSVVTYAAGDVTTSSARLNGNLTSLGAADNVTVSFVWGINWETNPDAYPNETAAVAMTATGTFYFDLSGLDPGTTYYYRAKAMGNGTSYGVEMSFNTFPPSPLVTTSDASNITANSARLNGDLTWLGTASSVTVSFEWKVSGGSYTPIDVEVNNSTGTFSVGLTGLTPGTTYYFKAKAVGDGDPVYGAEKSFTTLISPSVTTNAATGIGNTSATLNGNLTSLGTAGSVTVSFVWGTSPGSYPNETTSENMTSTGLFSTDLPGLSPGTMYYYQAKAVGDGTSSSVEMSFTTYTPPSVATNAATQVTANSARLNGELTSLGTASSVTVSFSWGTSPGSYANETAGVAKTAAGTFYFDLSGLSPNTAYYYQAKAVGDSTVYGLERTLATGQTPEIEAVDPSSGKQGQHLTITILGSNFDGATGVSFGSGIAVEDFDVNSSNAITAEIAIDHGAEVGARDVSVTTGGGTGTDTDGFGVVEGGGLPFWIWIAVGISGALAVSVLAYFVARGRTTRQNR
jgi:hypothetical protein